MGDDLADVLDRLYRGSYLARERTTTSPAHRIAPSVFAVLFASWRARQGSNLQPPDSKSEVLPFPLCQHHSITAYFQQASFRLFPISSCCFCPASLLCRY